MQQTPNPAEPQGKAEVPNPFEPEVVKGWWQEECHDRHCRFCQLAPDITDWFWAHSQDGETIKKRESNRMQLIAWLDIMWAHLNGEVPKYSELRDDFE